jgi:hypothetical protein
MIHRRAKTFLACLVFAVVFSLMLAGGAAGQGTPTGNDFGLHFGPWAAHALVIGGRRERDHGREAEGFVEPGARV